MATSVKTPRGRGASASPPAALHPDASPAAPLGPTLALTVTLALACFAVVLASLELIVQPEPLPPPFDLGERQKVEDALYLAAFGLILPLAVILVPRLADAIAAGANRRALPVIAACLAATLAASIGVARALPSGGLAEMLTVVGIWWVGAAGALARAGQARPWELLLRAVHLAPVLWAAAGALLLGSLLAFTSPRSIDPVVLGLGAVLPVVLLVYARRGVSGFPRPSPLRGAAIDAAVIAFLLLAVSDLVVFSSDSPLEEFKALVSKSHQDFLLGPANEVLHGGAVLVDTASQYGPGPLYLLAAWFQLAPIGYGTFGFLDGLLYGLLFAGGYSLLRLSATPRLLAGGAIALAVITLIYNLVFSVGSVPQHGPIRFGLPMVLTLAACVGARWPRRSRAARNAQLVVLGLSSVWALEAFAYTAATFAAIASFEAWIRPQAGRVAWLARRAALAALACVAAHATFVGVTLGFAGQPPDYGWYLAFLDEFLFGETGKITYDFAPWSPGLAVGAGYAASAAALLLLVRRRPEILHQERVAATGLVGTTAYGIALFSYLVNRSEDNILPYVSLPLLLAGTLWLSLLLRGALGGSRSARLGGLAFGLSLALLLLATAWSSIDDRLPRSALAHVLPGGRSAREAGERLWNLPPVDPRAPRGQELLARYMPGDQRVLTLLWPDLETEILIRSNLTSQLPLSFPPQDSFVSAEYLPELRRAVAKLQAGDRLLTDAAGLEAFVALRAQPSRDPLVAPVSRRLAPLQQWTLQQIGRRFDLKRIYRDDQEFVVAVLTPRR